MLPPVPAALTFDGHADHLLNHCRLIVGGRPHRLIEVEAYYHSAAHPDPFAHRHPIQLNFGRWYFHRSGESYRGGSFKGLDVTIGGPSAFGGMLLRGLETPDGIIIDGPSLLVDHLLATTEMKTVAELDAAIGERLVTDADSPLSLVLHADEQRPVWKSLRVGLSLKRQTFRQDDPAIRFLLRRDRYLTEPRRTKKGKPHLVLPLLVEGRSIEEIRVITGCLPSAIRRYQREMDTGRTETNTKRYYGTAVGTRELCRLFGRSSDFG